MHAHCSRVIEVILQTWRFLQMNIGHNELEEKKPKQKRKKKATSSSGDEFDENSKKKRGRPRTVKREDIEGFSDQEIRRFVYSEYNKADLFSWNLSLASIPITNVKIWKMFLQQVHKELQKVWPSNDKVSCAPRPEKKIPIDPDNICEEIFLNS